MLDLKKIAESALDSAFGGEDGRQLLFDLERHDRSYHPGGYEEGDICKFREALAKGDDADSSLAGGAGAEVAPGVVVEVCDITKQKVDAIVNAANRWMLGGGGVDGAIHRAAGPSLVAECAKYPPDANGYRVQTGEAKITGAGNLPAKWVVHTAGPDCREVTDMDEQDNLLADSYRNSLELAAKNGAKSIALPSISTGIFGFPLNRAAAIAAEEITDFRKKHPDVTVKMCLFDPNPAEANRIATTYMNAFKDSVKMAEARDTLSDWVHDQESIDWAKGKTLDECNERFGTELKPIAVVPEYFLRFFDGDASRNEVFSSKAYLIEHMANHGHPDIGVQEYMVLQTIFDLPDEVIKDTRLLPNGKKRDALLFVKRFGKNRLAAIELSEENGKIVLHKSLYNTRDRVYPSLPRVLSGGGRSPISHAEDSAPGGSLSARDEYIVPNFREDDNGGFGLVWKAGLDVAQDKDDTHTGEGWYGFDLDGTLAEFDGWKGEDHIGEPIQPMVDLAKKLHAEGKIVKILTARVAPGGEGDPEVAKKYIVDWCAKNLGFAPDVVCEKDQRLIDFYDDRAHQVVPNKGILVEDLKTAQDEDDAQQPSAQTVNLQKHDARFHPKGYKPGDSCKYREALAKGDDADMLQNAESSELWEGYKSWHRRISGNKAYTLQDIADLLKDPASLSHGDARAYLQGYQELYEEEMGAGAAAKSLSALASKVKGNGPTAALLQKRLSAVKNANAAKTPGVKTPEEMRDAVAKAYVDAAMAFAKSIGANISAPQAPKGSAAAAPSAAPTPTPSAQPAPQQPQPVPAPQAKPSPKQYGPRPALSNDEASFPSDADFDFDNYGQTTSGYRSAGSGSTNPHSIIVNGKKYYVKQAGNNPSYTNDAAENEVNANKFLRMAGLNAPESKLYTHNGVNYCVTKAADTAKGEVLSNLNDPKVRAQLAEAYPVMDLMYNTDILTNGDNAFLDKNGDVVFIDNGSSFGRSAQGTRNSVKKFGFDYDKRNDPFSSDATQSYGALARHSSQSGWRNGLSGVDMMEAAKWNLGDLVRDAISQGLVPKQAQSALQQFADSLDKASDKNYPNVRPKKQAASKPAPAPASPSPAPAASTAPSMPASSTTSAPPTTAAPAPASATSPAPALIAASLSSSSNPVAQNISTLFNSFMGHMQGTPFFNNTNGATFIPNGKGGGTLRYPQGFTLSNSNAMRGIFNSIATPLGLSITRPKGSNYIQFSPMTAKQKAAAQALVTANASLPGGATIGAVKFAPTIPAAIKNAITPLVQGNTAAHSVGFVNGNSGAVVLSLDGRPTAYRNAAFPPVHGYKTAYNGYGIVFIPTTPRSQQNSAGAAAQPAPASPAPTPAPSAPAMPQQSPAQPAAQPAAQQPAASQAPWQKRLQTIQSNTKNQALGSAYSAVANWLNNAQAQ